MSQALVTVAIPLYNNEAFIGEALASVFAQTYPHIEIVVADNCSTDNSLAVVQGYKDPRLRVFSHKENLGAEANWNFCLQQARGKYFKLLCSDDRLAPSCIAEQVAHLEADTNKELALVCCARTIINSRGREITVRKFPFGEGRHKGSTIIKRSVAYGTNFMGEPAAVLFRTALREKVGLFSAQPGYTIDLNYWCRLLRHGDLYALNAPLASFRLSKQSWSSLIGSQQYRHFWQFIDQQQALASPRISPQEVLLGKSKAFLLAFLRLASFKIFA